MGERRTNGLVLIIEDDEPISRVLQDVVMDIVGATALTVLSPELVRDPLVPDLVITDLVERDAHQEAAGRAYLSRVRTRFRAAPLMLVTTQHWVRSSSLWLPIDAVVLMPFDLDDLVTCIRALLGIRRRPAA